MTPINSVVATIRIVALWFFLSRSENYLYFSL